MKVLVTGGAGFIGSHLSDLLVGQGHTVVVLDDLSTGSESNVEQLRDDSRFTLVVGDVRELGAVEEAARAGDGQAPEVIFHLAAAVGVKHILAHPRRSLETNLKGTENVLTVAAGWLDPRRERAEAERLMREIGFTSKMFTPDSIVGQLSGGERQGVALARAIYNKADLIVMDEPTTALSLTETEKVFRFVRAVRAGGRSVLFIGHNVHHVFDIAERFVVMDRGTVALQATKEEVGSADHLIAFMERLAHPQGIDNPFAGTAASEVRS